MCAMERAENRKRIASALCNVTDMHCVIVLLVLYCEGEYNTALVCVQKHKGLALNGLSGAKGVSGIEVGVLQSHRNRSKF